MGEVLPPLPPLDGKRCLELAPADASRALEMERRGAEVVAVGADELDGLADAGTFDLAYVAGMLAHVRDPVLALERVRAVCRGELLLFDAIDPGLSALFPRLPVAGMMDGRWWAGNAAAVARMLEAAGFCAIDGGRVVASGRGPGIVPRLVGDHVWMRAVPLTAAQMNGEAPLPVRLRRRLRLPTRVGRPAPPF